ncbi:unnamed protein product [Fusarium graminearum]|nr:unnamed protein product [Fusarium graminearum]
MENSRRAKSQGCHGVGTLRTTATRGWRRDGCTGGTSSEEAIVVVVGGGGDLIEFEVTDVSGCGRWLVEEPRRTRGGLPISRLTFQAICNNTKS